MKLGIGAEATDAFHFCRNSLVIMNLSNGQSITREGNTNKQDLICTV